MDVSKGSAKNDSSLDLRNVSLNDPIGVFQDVDATTVSSLTAIPVLVDGKQWNSYRYMSKLVYLQSEPAKVQVGANSYSTLEKALDSAKDGDVVRLLDDIVLDKKITLVNKDVVLDLGGKSVICSASGTTAEQAGAIVVSGDSNVVVAGNGKFDFDDCYASSWSGSTGRLFEADGTATLTLLSGDFHAGIGCVLVDEHAKAVIEGGHYSTFMQYGGGSWPLNKQDGSSSSILVYGGSFEKYDPSASNTENPSANFCAEGYVATHRVLEGGIDEYTVVPNEDVSFAAQIGSVRKYVSIEAALQAANEGETVSLLSKIDEPCVVSKPISIDLADTGTDPDLFSAASGLGKVVSEDGKKIDIRKECNVSFVTGEGASDIDSQIVLEGFAPDRPSDPMRPGYRFEGWYSDEGLTSVFDFTAPIKSDVVLYAKWAPISSGGGTVVVPPEPGESVTNPDGSTTTTVTEEDGSTVSTTVSEDKSVTTVVEKDKDGNVASVEATVEGDKAPEATVALPMEPIAAASSEEAPEISVKAPAGTRVSVPVAKAEGAEDPAPGCVLVMVGADGSETAMSKTGLSESGLALEVPGDCTLKVVDASADFPDVSEDDWFAGVADFASARNVLTGVVLPDGTSEFQGDLGTTRAMFVTMLNRLELEPEASEGAPSFSDVDYGEDGDWFSGTASWAAEEGLLSGYGDGTFGGGDAVTREQVAVFLMRYAEWLGLDTSTRAESAAPDASEVSGWAAEAVSWATAEGYILGDEGTGAVRPADGASRAEAAAIVMRFVNSLY